MTSHQVLWPAIMCVSDLPLRILKPAEAVAVRVIRPGLVYIHILQGQCTGRFKWLISKIKKGHMLEMCWKDWICSPEINTFQFEKEVWKRNQFPLVTPRIMFLSNYFFKCPIIVFANSGHFSLVHITHFLFYISQHFRQFLIFFLLFWNFKF